MFLTSTRNQKITITGVGFVEINKKLNMAITTANKGVISMLALIVLKRILFLLDM
jgi:hypothetical protein